MNDTCQTVLVGGSAIQVFDANGVETHRPGAPRQTVHSIAIMPDGSRILTGDHFGTVSIFEAASTQPPRTFHTHAGPVYAAAFLDNGERFVTGGSPSDSTVRVWSSTTGEQQLVLMGSVGGVSELRASRDGTSLIALDAQGDVRVWDLESPDRTTVLRDHELYVYGAKFTPDGSRLVTCSWDRTVRIWDARTWECTGVLRGEHGYVTSLDISPDGRLIVTGHHTGFWKETEVRLWDAHTGVLLHDLPEQSGQITSVAFSPDGTRLATSALHYGTWVWNVPAKDDVAPTQMPELRHARSGPWRSAWSPNAKMLATSYEDGIVRIVDSASGSELRQWKAHERSANFIEFSPDGTTIVTASADATVKLWNASTGELVRALEGHRDIVWCAAFSPDGSRLATGSTDNTIRIWDIDADEQLLELRGHDDYVYTLDFSPDGTMLASGSGDHSVRIWDTVRLHQRLSGKGLQ
jgi:WD40 repeat protein